MMVPGMDPTEAERKWRQDKDSQPESWDLVVWILVWRNHSPPEAQHAYCIELDIETVTVCSWRRRQDLCSWIKQVGLAHLGKNRPCWGAAFRLQMWEHQGVVKAMVDVFCTLCQHPQLH